VGGVLGDPRGLLHYVRLRVFPLEPRRQFDLG
jgi:hypothetical protein